MYVYIYWTNSQHLGPPVGALVELAPIEQPPKAGTPTERDNYGLNVQCELRLNPIDLPRAVLYNQILLGALLLLLSWFSQFCHWKFTLYRGKLMRAIPGCLVRATTVAISSVMQARRFHSPILSPCQQSTCSAPKTKGSPTEEFPERMDVWILVVSDNASIKRKHVLDYRSGAGGKRCY